MITKIDKIDIKTQSDHNDLWIIWFKYGDLDRFTYLTKKSRDYWLKRGIKEFKIGMPINVIPVEPKYYKIIGAGDEVIP